MGKLSRAAINALKRKTAELQERERCGQYPKGPKKSPCTKPIKRGWDTCGRPDCAAWKLVEDEDWDQQG